MTICTQTKPQTLLGGFFNMEYNIKKENLSKIIRYIKEKKNKLEYDTKTKNSVSTERLQDW